MSRVKHRYEVTAMNDHGARVKMATVIARSQTEALQKAVKKFRKRNMPESAKLVTESGRANLVR